MLCAEHSSGERVLRQCAMAKHVLIRHLNTVGPLRSDPLDGSPNVHGPGVFQSRYANIQGAKCTWKTMPYMRCL